MKASYLTEHGGPEVLQYGELPQPVAGPGEVVVRVKAAALNHLDLWVRGGLPGLKLQFPHVLGGDAAGIVHSIGPGVSDVAEGDEVIVHPGLSCGHCDRCLSGWESLCLDYRILGEHVSGTHAEFAKAPRANIFKKPPSVSWDDAAAFGLVFTTAWQMLHRRASVQPGDTVVVHAAGSGVGSAGVQIAKLLGAKVIATAGNWDKLKLAESLGADRLVDYSTGDWVKEVKKIAPLGADVIFDHLGKDYWDANLRAIRRGGRIVLCGATTGGAAALDLAAVFFRQIQILGSTMGSKGDFPRLLGLLEAGKLRAVVDKAYPLSQASQALSRMSDRLQFGKILLHPGQ